MRKLISVLLAAVMLFSLASCGLHDSSTETSVVKTDYDVQAAIKPYLDNLMEMTEDDKNYQIEMGYNDCDHMVTAIIGEKCGLYEALGLHVNVTKSGKTKDGLVSGEMDVGYASLTGMLKAGSEGAPVMIPAGSHLGGSKYIVVRTDIEKPEDMLGKTLVISSNDMVQPNWRSFCNQIGIPFITDYYEQIDMGSSEKNIALKAGQIDGYIDCDPYASIAEFEGIGKIVGTEWGAAHVSDDRTEGWGVHCGYYLNTDFAAAHPALAQRLVLAHCLAIQYMYLHPYNAAMMFADGFGVNPAVGLRTIYIKLCAEGRTICYKIDETNIQNYKDYYASFAIPENKRPVLQYLEQFVDTSIYDTLGMVDFYEFIKNEVDPLYPIMMDYADFLETAETIDGIDHSSTVGKEVEKWMNGHQIVDELDQTKRLCEYDFSGDEMVMTWDIDPETLEKGDLYKDYKAGTLQ
ncbi:MAG: ABC transporter substrate-binding protein [Firmicutes bacterium]|nr:ABC transporter substrate-binding protein [Bacillota bacterium]MBQ1524105.1 ABC transporter substrate-binding protein [Bacillota bacterium]MBQ1888484.1 ABC transporter substrate-binding protein [Bacillota bacterium]MBQ2456219.1 ABC transporter substrate-binding protein [Bacillota bacterium]MBQ3577787.1 ABC transporter substrate-binding protein [Bacillota bacterium]